MVNVWEPQFPGCGRPGLAVGYAKSFERLLDRRDLIGQLDDVGLAVQFAGSGWGRFANGTGRLVFNQDRV
ncbi:MAG: hypothetical protein ACRDSZ_04395 [Pseudonocardiaceae bacterium]